MADEIIKVVLSGVDEGLDKSFSTASKQLGNFTKSVSDASNSLPQLKRATDNAIGGAKTMSVAHEKMGASVYIARDAVLDLGHVARDLPYAANNIAILAGPIGKISSLFSTLTQQTGSIGGAFGALKGALAGGGGLVIGFELAISAIALFKDTIFGSTALVDQAKKKNEDYSKSVKDAFGEVSQQAAKVETLVASLNRENLSQREKVAIVKELQTIAPTYFANLNAEKATIEQLTTAYKNYAAGLRNAAEGKVLDKQLQDIIDKRIQLERVLNPNQFIIDDNGKKIRNFVYEDANAIKAKSQNQAEYNNLLKAEEVISNRIAQLTPPDVTKADLTAPKTPKGPADQFNFFDKFFDVTPAKNRVEKQLTEMADAAREFARKNNNILQGLNPILSATSDEQAVEAGRKFWESYSAGLLKFKIPTIKPVVTIDAPTFNEAGYQAGIDALRASFEGKQDDAFGQAVVDASFDKNKVIDLFKTKFAQVGAELPKTLAVENAFGLIENIKLDGNIDIGKLQRALAEALDNIKKNINTKVGTIGAETGKALNEALEKISTAGFDNLGKAIGDALGGNGITDALHALGSSIGQAVVALGEKFIALGVAGLLAKKAFAALISNPFAAIAAGVAVVALGTAFENISVPHLAQGGIVPPGFSGDRFPAMLNSGEAVIPLDRLSSIVGSGGGPQVIILNQRLRGRDSILQQARESKSQRRGG